MRISLKNAAVATAIGATAAVAISATPAFATDRVACGDRTDFVRLDIDLGNGLGTNQCFANGGVYAPDAGGVYHVDSGNNNVTVQYEDNGRLYSFSLSHWQGVGLPDVYVTTIWLS